MNPILEADAEVGRAAIPQTVCCAKASRLEVIERGQDARGGRLEACPTIGTLRWLGALVGMLAALCLTGCSTFERDWRTAGQAPSGTNASIAGRWEGTWLSDVNGHHDQLRCLMTPLTNGLHSARFHAKYKKGIFRFSFSYSVPLHVRRTNDGFQFEGEADLGWLAGGIYRYEGSATGTNFFSTYRCKYDHGTFQMMRPPGSHQP